MTSNPECLFGDARLPERFWSKVAIASGGCWEWQACVGPNGYGYLGWNGGTDVAHRIIVTAIRGPIPKGMHVDHLCRNRICVNLSHLEVVTPAENTRRGTIAEFNRERAAKITHCPQGHPYDEANTYTDKRGKRQCKTCSADRLKARRAAGGARNAPGTCLTCGGATSGRRVTRCQQCARDAKLTWEQAQEIRARHIPGRGGNSMELAREYGISKRHLLAVAKGEYRSAA